MNWAIRRHLFCAALFPQRKGHQMIWPTNKIFLKHCLEGSFGWSKLKTLSRVKVIARYKSTLCFKPITIFSLSSGHGKCGVAVIRVSGSKVKDIMDRMTSGGREILPRKAELRKILDPENKLPIDRGLILYFQGPHSFTGEDCLEFQVHGGPAVISSLLGALHKIPGCSQAEPGEFTKRAFMNGKLDLTEVEGLGDLIHAETEVQRKQALRQMDGDLSRLYTQWRKTIIKCVADLEAFIDFSEDQNIEEVVTNRVRDMVKSLKEEISRHVNDKRQGERLRQGVHVTILGEPNVGKSSLLNAICQRPAAIVTEIAGTTRDVIESPVNIDGYPVLLSDTAGIRETRDIVEKVGVIRAVDRAKKSDIRIFMFDVVDSTRDEHFNLRKMNFSSYIHTFLENYWSTSDSHGSDKYKQATDCNKELTKQYNGTLDKLSDFSIDFDDTIIVLNKIDLMPKDDLERLIKNVKTQDFNLKSVTNSDEYNKTQCVIKGTRGSCDSDQTDILKESDLRNSVLSEEYDKYSSVTNVKSAGSPERTNKLSVCCISCVTGEGMENFVSVLGEKVANMCGNPLAGHPSLTQTRHRSHLVTCLENLDQFDHMIDDDIVLASEYLRRALREIGKITGKVSAEEILDVIFKDFCIGK